LRLSDTTSEPLSDEEITDVWRLVRMHRSPFSEKVMRLINEHARLKATVERVKKTTLCTSAGCKSAISKACEACGPETCDGCF
jgi:hypothetical protein